MIQSYCPKREKPPRQRGVFLLKRSGPEGPWSDLPSLAESVQLISQAPSPALQARNSSSADSPSAIFTV